ncbi:MAG: beta-lactamase family protein [Ignavibacteriaceae bacterium]|nr:beta-lactamase family protein [Ignavibacteriaceae bacterium]
MKLTFLLALLALGFLKAQTPAINLLSHISGGISQHQIDTIFSRAQFFPDNTQLSVAVIENGEVKFYGVIRENDSLKYTNNSQNAFEVGSITKVFTSTLLANMVVSGKISLEDKINAVFPVEFKDGIEISYKQLANHTSGLPRLPSNMGAGGNLDPKNPYKYYDEKALLDYLSAHLALEYEAGSKSNYSNLGTGLLASALKYNSGLSFDKMAEDWVFDKYDMKNSTLNENDVAGILIKGRNPEGEITPVWSLSALTGAGGILSTAEDLTKFLLAQFNPENKELALTREKTFEDNPGMDIGLGWMIIKRKDGAKWYWHNGGTGGYTSFMAVDLEKKSGVVVLSNLSAYHPKSRSIDDLGFALMRSLK